MLIVRWLGAFGGHSRMGRNPFSALSRSIEFEMSRSSEVAAEPLHRGRSLLLSETSSFCADHAPKIGIACDMRYTTFRAAFMRDCWSCYRETYKKSKADFLKFMENEKGSFWDVWKSHQANYWQDIKHPDYKTSGNSQTGAPRVLGLSDRGKSMRLIEWHNLDKFSKDWNREIPRHHGEVWVSNIVMSHIAVNAGASADYKKFAIRQAQKWNVRVVEVQHFKRGYDYSKPW